MSVFFRKCICLSWLLFSCALLVSWHTHAGWASQQPADKHKLVDGFYTLVETAAQKQKLKPRKDEIIVKRVQKSAGKSTVEYFLLKRKPAVPLLLVEPPSVRKIDEDAVGVFLTLKNSMAARLENYTRKNKGKQVAIVIENQVVSTHTVRETIRGGKLKITSCPREAIQGLIKQLKNRKP